MRKKLILLILAALWCIAGDVKADTQTVDITSRFSYCWGGEESLTRNDDVWYTLDGRRLSGAPSRYGLYVHQGRKIIIK